MKKNILMISIFIILIAVPIVSAVEITADKLEEFANIEKIDNPFIDVRSKQVDSSIFKDSSISSNNNALQSLFSLFLTTSEELTTEDPITFRFVERPFNKQCNSAWTQLVIYKTSDLTPVACDWEGIGKVNKKIFGSQPLIQTNYIVTGSGGCGGLGSSPSGLKLPKGNYEAVSRIICDDIPFSSDTNVVWSNPDPLGSSASDFVRFTLNEFEGEFTCDSEDAWVCGGDVGLTPCKNGKKFLECELDPFCIVEDIPPKPEIFAENCNEQLDCSFNYQCDDGNRKTFDFCDTGTHKCVNERIPDTSDQDSDNDGIDDSVDEDCDNDGVPNVIDITSGCGGNIGSGFYCGDGVCNAGESLSTCFSDCSLISKRESGSGIETDIIDEEGNVIPRNEIPAIYLEDFYDSFTFPNDKEIKNSLCITTDQCETIRGRKTSCVTANRIEKEFGIELPKRTAEKISNAVGFGLGCLTSAVPGCVVAGALIPATGGLALLPSGIVCGAGALASCGIGGMAGILVSKGAQEEFDLSEPGLCISRPIEGGNGFDFNKVISKDFLGLGFDLTNGIAIIGGLALFIFIGLILRK